MTTKTKYNKYPIIDSIAKGVIIDGITMFSVFACYQTPLKQNIIKSSIYSAFAGASYLIRTDAREDGHEYFGGILGGAIKYGLRTVFINSIYPDKELDTTIKFNNEIIFKSIVGSTNNVAYETCNNNEICSNHTPSNLAFATFTETAEVVGTSILKGDLTVKDTFIGAFGGILGGSLANYVYVPNIDKIHQAYDTLEDNIIALNSYKESLDTISKDPLSLVNDLVNSAPHGKEIANIALSPFVFLDEQLTYLSEHNISHHFNNTMAFTNELCSTLLTNLGLNGNHTEL